MVDKRDMSNEKYDLVIFEDGGFVNLLPLVYWRGVFELRCGCQSLRERICRMQGAEDAQVYVREELAAVTAQRDGLAVREAVEPAGRVLFVNGRSLLFEKIVPGEGQVAGMKGGQVVYVWAEGALARRLTGEVFRDAERLRQALTGVPVAEWPGKLIDYPWHLVHNNGAAIEADWRLMGRPKIAGRVCAGAYLLAKENIHICSGSVIKPGVVLDAESGPIIIGQNVTIKPNCSIEGPVFIGDGSLIQPGASIGEGVSIGEVCKVGGELESSILHSYSNKQHDGFLGHSYIGQWVNLAADTINSDLKNTYGSVRVSINGREVDSGEMFVGLTMGDHTKTGVNTVFSTGSVVGFGCSLFLSHFTPRFVPSFSWLTDEGRQEAIVPKVLEVAEVVMARRQVVMTAAMKELFLKIPEMAKRYEKT